MSSFFPYFCSPTPKYSERDIQSLGWTSLFLWFVFLENSPVFSKVMRICSSQVHILAVRLYWCIDTSSWELEYKDVCCLLSFLHSPKHRNIVCVMICERVRLFLFLCY